MTRRAVVFAFLYSLLATYLTIDANLNWELSKALVLEIDISIDLDAVKVLASFHSWMRVIYFLVFAWLIGVGIYQGKIFGCIIAAMIYVAGSEFVDLLLWTAFFEFVSLALTDPLPARDPATWMVVGFYILTPMLARQSFLDTAKKLRDADKTNWPAIVAFIKSFKP